MSDIDIPLLISLCVVGAFAAIYIKFVMLPEWREYNRPHREAIAFEKHQREKARLEYMARIAKE